MKAKEITARQRVVLALIKTRALTSAEIGAHLWPDERCGARWAGALCRRLQMLGMIERPAEHWKLTKRGEEVATS